MSIRTAGVGILAAALWLAAGPAQGQEARDPALVRVSAFAGASLFDNPAGLRVGRDVLTLSARLTWPLQGVQPWVQVERFTRPDLLCFPQLPCNREGWTALGGAVVSFSRDDTQPGIHSHLVGGAGMGFSAENEFAYLLGVGASLVIFPRVAPSFEVRWENLPGTQNVIMLNLGLQLDLF